MTEHDYDDIAPPEDPNWPATEDYEAERLRDLDWRYTPTNIEDQEAESPRVGEVCTAAIIALAHAYLPIEFCYNAHYLATTLDDDFDYDTLGHCIADVLEKELPNLPLPTFRLVDRILASYESVMVDGSVLHASLTADDDTRSRWAVEASISLRSRRIVREVDRQLHVDGHVGAAEAALDFAGRLNGTPVALLRATYA